MPEDDGFEVPDFLKKLIERLNPADVFIISGGFYLGYQLGIRPGLPIGPFFFGLPDLRPAWDEPQREIDRLEVSLGLARDELAIWQTEVARDPLRTQEARPFIQELQKRILELSVRQGIARSALNSLRLGQGIEMALVAYALTRPGFIPGIAQAVGEILPG